MTCLMVNVTASSQKAGWSHGQSDCKNRRSLTSMRADKLRIWDGGGVVLPYSHPKLLHFTLRHQPWLMNPL